MNFAMIALGTDETLEVFFVKVQLLKIPTLLNLFVPIQAQDRGYFRLNKRGRCTTVEYMLYLPFILFLYKRYCPSVTVFFYHFHCAELLMVHSDNSKEIK